MFRPLLTLSLLLALVPGAALAQRVYWEPGAGSLAYNQASPLQLVFENCQPEGDPKIPSVDGLEMQYTGSGSTISMENLSVTRHAMLNYAVRPTKRPEVTIPAFDVETNKGTKHVAAATFAIGNATVGQSAIPLETAVVAHLAPADGEFWAGEVFPVTYTLEIARRFSPRSVGALQWNPAPLVIEDWSKPEQIESNRGGEPRIGIVYRTRGCFTAHGNYALKPANQETVLMVPSSGGLFSLQNELIQPTITSNAPALTIKPLPDGAPADFGGAVGQFTFTAKVVPTSVAVGEPITWTLELGGTGNWPDIHGLPAREVSKDFKVLQPQAKRTPAEGRLFDATLTEDAVLIPTQPGAYTLGPVSYSYFDPRSGSYQTVQTKPVTVTITPPGAAEPGNRPLFTPPTSTSTAPPAAPTTYKPQLPAAPAAPAAIPRDPLSGADTGLVPLSRRALALGLLTSVLWLLPVWLVLAALCSRRTDPLRFRRAARARLVQTLAHLRNATTTAARLQMLHAWQRDAATLLGIAHAAPSPAILAGKSQIPDSKFQTNAELNRWIELWSEADHALYGINNTLPDNWVVRAEAALEATRVPGWPPSSLFQSRNLLPWFRSETGHRKPASAEASAVALRAMADKSAGRPETGTILTIIILLSLLSGIGHPVSAMAADGAVNPGPRTLNYFSSPLAAYNAGEFATAEQAWRIVLTRTPTDWVTRHNLALALAQQGHWPEAAAQWTSAFLLNPRDESVRWHLALGYERAGYTPPGLGEFAQASGPHLVARLASPAEWQWLLVAAGVVLAAGLLLLLLRAYRGSANGWMRRTALAVVGVALVLMLAAVASLHFYGDTADARAAIAWHQVLLRSIPTEADTQQKTSSLPAGSLAVVDKTFLGWVRLSFPSGQTGWVRQEDIVWLYR
jgi:hypothetical protein